MDTFDQILTELLESIGYTEDKQVFVNEFKNTVQLQAIFDLTSKLDKVKSDQFNQKMALAGKDAEKLSLVIKEFFTEAQMEEAVQKATTDSIVKFIKSVEPTLSDLQKLELYKIIEKRKAS